MRYSGPVVADRYVDVEYHQHSQNLALRLAMRIAGVLTWPLVIPLALLARTSDVVFRTVSELLALAPYLFGVIVRYEFYRMTLRRCGRNVSIGFGTVFLYRDIEIGDHVTITMRCTIHHCDIGSYALIGDGTGLLSGSRYHNFDRTDIPMALQGGKLRRIRIGCDCWVGDHAIVMDDVGEGSIVGAGSVVTRPVEPYSIVAGNPARLLRRRR